MFAAYAARSAREIELQALVLLAALAQNLHATICRSFTELSSDLRAKFGGGSRSAKSRRSWYARQPVFSPQTGCPVPHDTRRNEALKPFCGQGCSLTLDRTPASCKLMSAPNFRPKRD